MLRNVLRFVTALTIAIFAMVAIPTTTFAGTPDEDAFKKILVDHLWKVKWESVWKSGKNDMSFAVDANGNITGKLFNFNTPDQDATLKNISVKDTCIRFTSAVTGTKFKYCLNPDGTLDGDLDGMTGSGQSWTATAKATPAAR